MDNAALAADALRQDGLWTRLQARTAGFSNHQCQQRLATGDWVEVLPHVYHASVTPMNRAREWRAALLWAGTKAMLSNRSGACVWKLEGVREGKVEVMAKDGHKRHPNVVVHRSGVLLPTDVRHVDGLRVAAPALTIIGLAGDLSSEELEVAFKSARAKRLVTLEEVERRLGPIAGRGRRGAGDLSALLRELKGCAPSESTLEVRVARRLRRARFPRSVRQCQVGRFRLDFAWPEVRVALECDGRRWHSDAKAFQRDRERWSALAAEGWRIIFVTAYDLSHNWPTIEANLRLDLTCAA